jgi:two-component system OmpR family response regulator
MPHVLERLREQGHCFPMLMLSALGATDERIEGLETGADDSMAKSFLWRELQLQLERCCQMHGGCLALNRSSLGGLQAELHLPKN